MTFRRFTKLIRAYPYLLNDTYVRSSSEADALFRDFAPSLGEAVARAKARADLPQEAWAYLESLAERIDRKNGRKQRIREIVNRFGARLRSRRRVVAACVAVLIVLAYFTLIPSGRTIARNIFERMFTIADRSLEIEHPVYLEAKGDAAVSEDEEYFYETSSYASVSEYIAATNIVPFHIDDERFVCTGVTEINVSDVGRRLWIGYQYEDSVNVAFRQEWLITGKETAYNSITDHKQMKVQDTELLYVYDTEDNSFNGITSMKDGSILHININPLKYSEEILLIMF